MTLQSLPGEQGRSSDPSRQRRDRSARRGSRDNSQPLLNRVRRWSDHWMPYAMAGAAVAFAGTVFYRTHIDTAINGAFGAGMTRNDVRYVLGNPTELVDGGRRWLYRDDNRTVTVNYNGDLLDSTTCTSRNLSPTDCVPTHRIVLGMSEDQVWNLLGEPTRERIDGLDKFLEYRDIGLLLRLTQFRVSAITMRPRSSPISVVPRAIRIMFP